MRRLQSLSRKRHNPFLYNGYGSSNVDLNRIADAAVNPPFQVDEDTNGKELYNILTATVATMIDEVPSSKGTHSWLWRGNLYDAPTCWGYCNFDFDEAVSELSTMSALLGGKASEYPQTVLAWNKMLDKLSYPEFKIAIPSSTPSQTSSSTNGTGSTSSTNGQTSSSNGQSSSNGANGTNGTNGEDEEDKFSLSPVAIGAGVGGLALLIFIIMRMRKK